MINTFLKKMDKAENPWLRVGLLETTFPRNDALSIIKSSFNELTKRAYFHYIDQKLFLYLVDYPEDAKDEILYLLNSKKSMLHLLSPKQLNHLIQVIPEVFDLVMERFLELDLTSEALVRDLTNATLGSEKHFMTLAKRIFTSKSETVIRNFIHTLAYGDNFSDYTILKPLIKDARVKSIPSIMSDHTYLDDNLRAFLIDNFLELYNIEKERKMDFIYCLKYDLPDDVKVVFEYLFSLLRASNVPKTTINYLNILLANNAGAFIKDYIGDNEVSYIKSGSTAQAFKIGEDKVLKFAKMKHMPNSIFEHFLLAPTERMVTKDDAGNPTLYIERQKYLKQVYNGIPINSDDYENFFNEAKKQRLIIRDPHCVRRYADNFGFLNDYHEATLVGVDDHEKLPDWFKRRPFVLFDIDMVIKDTSDNDKKKMLKFM